jgi:hypothetical protein
MDFAERAVAERASFLADEETVVVRMSLDETSRFLTDIYQTEIYCWNRNVIAKDFSVNFS